MPEWGQPGKAKYDHYATRMWITGPMVVVGGDPANDAPGVVVGESAQLGKERVDRTAAVGWVDVQVIEEAADACGQGPGEGSVVREAGHLPAVVFDQQAT